MNIKKYSPKKFLIVNLNALEEIKIKNTVVKFIPFHHLVNKSIIDV